MKQQMNPAIERALWKAAHMDDPQGASDESGLLRVVSRAGDPAIKNLTAARQANPLAVGLKQQLGLALARMRGLIEPDERSAQMRLVADLQARLGREMSLMQKFG